MTNILYNMNESMRRELIESTTERFWSLDPTMRQRILQVAYFGECQDKTLANTLASRSEIGHSQPQWAKRLPHLAWWRLLDLVESVAVVTDDQEWMKEVNRTLEKRKSRHHLNLRSGELEEVAPEGEWQTWTPGAGEGIRIEQGLWSISSPHYQNDLRALAQTFDASPIHVTWRENNTLVQNHSPIPVHAGPRGRIRVWQNMIGADWFMLRGVEILVLFEKTLWGTTIESNKEYELFMNAVRKNEETDILIMSQIFALPRYEEMRY